MRILATLDLCYVNVCFQVTSVFCKAVLEGAAYWTLFQSSLRVISKV